jgi:cytidyltransferase-like protein
MSTNVIRTSFDYFFGPVSVRAIEEAFKRANEPLTVELWTDDAIRHVTSKRPNFTFAERKYLVESLRFVREVVPTDDATEVLPDVSIDLLETFPQSPPRPENPRSSRKKVLVTGCFDWLHSGHVRFFEEASELGDLYVIVGHDANIKLLKGHAPMFPEHVRRYMVSAIRFVSLALISTGEGWMDAAPEIERIKPDIYAVNEDGDRPEKREFCQRNDIKYHVLKREPKHGLPRRQSTQLRRQQRGY